MKDVQLLSEVYIKEIAEKPIEASQGSFKDFGMFTASDNISFWKNFVLSTTSVFDNTDEDAVIQNMPVKVVDTELFDILQQGIEKYGKITSNKGSALKVSRNPEKLFLTNPKQDSVIFLDLAWNYAVLYLK